MAICNIIDDPGRTQEQYEQISVHVRRSGPVLPDGCRLALLGRERAITVWDAPEQCDRFLAERVGPAYEAVGRSLDEAERTLFEVDMLVAGDLVGVGKQLAGVEA
jgi:hypothetical protein